METTKILVRELPVMAVFCKSCPFKPDNKGHPQNRQLADEITARTLFQDEQICHKDFYKKGVEQFRCKGSFDFNQIIYDRINQIKK